MISPVQGGTAVVEPKRPAAADASTKTAAQTGKVASQLRSLQLADRERGGKGGSSLGKWIFRLGVLGVLAGGGYWAVQSGQADQFRSKLQTAYAVNAAPKIESVVVQRETPSEVLLDLTGYIVPKTKINISPRIPGQIVKLDITEGRKMKKGDLLAQIDDLAFQADHLQAIAALSLAQSRLDELKNGALPEEVAQAQSAVDQAQSTFDLAKKERDRAMKLQNTISASEFDTAVNRVRDAEANLMILQRKFELIVKGARPERIVAAEADVAQAQAMVKKAAYFLENSKILAPIDGTVVQKNVEIGETLRPEVLLTNMCMLADLDHMEVKVDIQERDLHRIKIGQKCTVITDAYQDHKYQGVIDRRQPMVNRQRGVVEVTITVVDPDDNLLPDMNCRVMFLMDEAEAAKPAIWIDKTAVEERGEQNQVYVLVDGHAKIRNVTLGRKEGKLVEVTAGLEEKEVLLLPNGQKLTDGQQVNLK